MNSKMVDEEYKKYVLQYFSCHPNDFNTGRLRLSTEVMKRIGARINQPVKIKQDCGYVFCNVWPLTVNTVGVFQVDPYVSLCSKQTKANNKGAFQDDHSCLRIPGDVCVLYPVEAKQVFVRVVLLSSGNLQQSHSWLRQKEQTLERKAKSMLLGHCITAGCVITPKRFRNNFRTLTEDIEQICVSSAEPYSQIESDEKVFVVTRKTRIHVTSVTMGSEESQNKPFVLGGLEDTVEMLCEIIRVPFLFPESFLHLGLELPKGVLLQGAPGVGKTLLVRTVVSKCNAQIVTLNGTDVFGPHSGESEEYLRKIFEKAR